MISYRDFIERKRVSDPATGLRELPWLAPQLFPFQRDIVGWALRRGRAALFAGTGLGKSLMELAWADALHRAKDIDTLLLTPLAVAGQMIREAGKFGIPARHVARQSDCGAGVNVTNYAKLDHFDLSKFGAIILDESSILKAQDGKTRTHLIEACSRIPFRLAATATPAPNDFMELGNHAEFLGAMSYAEMLAMFFVHDGGETQKWRLKGHAQSEFWKWMCQWAVMLRRPSDLGYANDGYDLPPLLTHQHTVAVEYEPDMETGLLFPVEAQTLQERISARRGTVEERVAAAVSLVIGSFRATLAECGSQNTPSADGSAQQPTLNIRLAETRRGTGQIKKSAANTCANTGSNISAAAKPKTELTSEDESDTHPIQTLPTSAARHPLPETRARGATDDFWLSSGSTQSNMTQSSLARVGAVQSATSGRQTEDGTGSPLITVTKQAASEDYCAANATRGLGNSPTTPIGSPAQSSIYGGLETRPWVIWCQTNAEQDELKRRFGDLAISIYGSLSEDEKERRHLEWLSGAAPILLTKCTIFGYGLNWQHCRDTAFVGLNDSFEQVFQAIRRFWRFGQTQPVNVHFIASEIEGAVVANLRRKEADAERMADAMIEHMADLSSSEVRGVARTQTDYAPTKAMTIPAFMRAA